MAASALAFQPPKPRRGWAPVPHCLAMQLNRALTELPYRVMSTLLDETAKPNGEFVWTRLNLGYYAYWCNATVSDTGKAFRQLERPPEDGGYGLLRSRRVGRMKQYQFIPEHIDQLKERTPRTLRKPPSAETSVRHETSETEAKEKSGYSEIETIETGVVIEMIPAVDSSCVSPSLQALSDSLEPEGDRATVHQAPPEPIDESRVTSTDSPSSWDSDELEDFCVLHLTPKLGTCPDPKVIERSIRVLGPCPVEHLKTHILRRFEAIKSWPFIAILAEDVAQAHTKLRTVRARHPVQYDLEPDWASATRVRALYSSGETPEAVKAEIVLMWPELKAQAKAKRPNVKTASLEAFCKSLKGKV